MATLAPCAANSRAVANPIPRGLAAPEMTATLPARSICSSLIPKPFAEVNFVHCPGPRKRAIYTFR